MKDSTLIFCVCALAVVTLDVLRAWVDSIRTKAMLHHVKEVSDLALQDHRRRAQSIEGIAKYLKDKQSQQAPEAGGSELDGDEPDEDEVYDEPSRGAKSFID